MFLWTVFSHGKRADRRACKTITFFLEKIKRSREKKTNYRKINAAISAGRARPARRRNVTGAEKRFPIRRLRFFLRRRAGFSPRRGIKKAFRA